MPSEFDWERFFNDDRFTAEEVNPHITIATRAWQEKNVMSSHFDVKGATEELEDFLATTGVVDKLPTCDTGLGTSQHLQLI